MHQKVRIPASFCPDFAKRNDVCSGEQQCGLTHGTWPVIIEAINSGTVPKHPHTVAVMEETHSTRGRDRSERGGNGKGGKGGRSHSGHGDTSVGRGRGKGKDGGSGKCLRSQTPGLGDKSGPVCTRCKNPGHTQSQCYATYDAAGNILTSEKQVEVPEGARTRSRSRGQANSAERYDPGDNEGFFYKGPVAHRGQAYVVSGEAAVLPAPEEKGPINPPPLKGSAFQFIPACFRSLWFLFLCAGMIPATMTTVVKDQKGIL